MTSSDEKKSDASASARAGAREPSKITISDDSEIECADLKGTGRFGPASFSITTRRCSTGLKPSSRKKKRKGKFEFSHDLPFDDLPDMDVNTLSTIDLGDTAVQWLEEVDALRRKSSNLQGRVSGQMRDRVRRTQDVVSALVVRAEAKGDPIQLKNKNLALSDSLYAEKKNLRKEGSRLPGKKGERSTE